MGKKSIDLNELLLEIHGYLALCQKLALLVVLVPNFHHHSALSISLSNPGLGKEDRGQGYVRPLIDVPLLDGQHGTMIHVRDEERLRRVSLQPLITAKWDRVARALQVSASAPASVCPDLH